MAILIATNSPLEIGGTLSTAATGRDSDFAPTAVSVLINDDGGGNPFGLQTDEGATDTIWTHFTFLSNNDGFINQNASGYMMTMYDAQNRIIARVDWNGGARAQVYQAGTPTVSDQLINFTQDLIFTFDVRVIVNPTEITMDIFINGSSVSLSRATVPNTENKTVPNKFIWDNFDLSWDLAIPATFYYSEFIITDGEDTRGWRLATLEPNAVGGETGWIGDWNELGDRNGSTASTSDVDAARVSSNLTPYGGGVGAAGIRAVIPTAIAQRGTTGVSQLTQFVRIGGTNYDGTPVSLVAGERGNFREIYEVNPATGLAWSTGDLAALEIGLLVNT
jgi:hypothetical protein